MKKKLALVLGFILFKCSSCLGGSAPSIVMPCWGGGQCTSQCIQDMASRICSTVGQGRNFFVSMMGKYCTTVSKSFLKQYKGKGFTKADALAWEQTCTLYSARQQAMQTFMNQLAGTMIMYANNSQNYEKSSFNADEFKNILACLCPSSADEEHKLGLTANPSQCRIYRYNLQWLISGGFYESNMANFLDGMSNNGMNCSNFASPQNNPFSSVINSVAVNAPYVNTPSINAPYINDPSVSTPSIGRPRIKKPFV